MAHADIRPAEDPPRRVGAPSLIRDTSGRVLLVRTSYGGGRWQLPGGAAHAGEPPHVARRRELDEETGLQQPTGALLLVDYTPASQSGVERLDVVFDGGTVADGTLITLPEALPGEDEPELTDHAFVDPDRLAHYCGEHQTRRIRAALAVLADPRAPRYLYVGAPPRDYVDAG